MGRGSVGGGLVAGTGPGHPTAGLALKSLGVETARGLAGIIVSVGLAQNLAALRALMPPAVIGATPVSAQADAL